MWDPLEHQFTNFLDLNQNIITSPLPLFSDREGNTTLKIYKFVSLFVKESVVNRFSDQYFERFAIDNWLPGSAGSQGHWDEPKSNLPSYWERLFQIQLYFIINVISKLSPYVTFNNIRILCECWLTFRKCLQVLRVHYIHTYGVSYKFQNTGIITIYPITIPKKNWVQHEFL